MFDIAKVLQIIRPGEAWTLNGDSYDGLEWLSDTEKPTEEEINQEINRLNAEWQATEYQRLRAKEYPDFKDYLDGMVKGDQDQIDAYIAACLAVKEKYPKP